MPRPTLIAPTLRRLRGRLMVTILNVLSIAYIPFSVVHIESDRLLSPSKRFNWLFPLAAPLVYWRLQRDIRLMHEFTAKIVRERRAILERSKADGSYQPLST